MIGLLIAWVDLDCIADLVGLAILLDRRHSWVGCLVVFYIWLSWRFGYIGLGWDGNLVRLGWVGLEIWLFGDLIELVWARMEIWLGLGVLSFAALMI